MNATEAHKLSTDSEQLADEVNYLKIMEEIESVCRGNDFVLYTSTRIRPATIEKLEKEGFKIKENYRMTEVSWLEAKTETKPIIKK